jgi:hypothetical protein
MTGGWPTGSPRPPTSCSPWAPVAGRFDGITANALNPGFILTNLQRNLDDDTMRAFGVMDEDGNLTPPHYKTPAQGAATSVLLAASPLLDAVTGRYFEDNQEAQVVPADAQGGGVAAHALDPGAADRLWEYAGDTVRAWSQAQ